MRMLTLLSATLCAAHLAAGEARAQAGRFPIRILLPPPVRPPVPPPVWQGGFVPVHVPAQPQSAHSQRGGDATALAVVLIGFGVVVLLAVGWWKLTHRGEQPAPSSPAGPPPAAPPLEDLILSAEEVADKARDTRTLLERAAQHDPLLSPSHLEVFITATFLQVQECWQKRDYGPVQNLLEEGLLAEHEALLQCMRRENVLNRLDGLRVRRLEFVHACCPEDADRQEVTALLTFEARSYYVDDRSGDYRGGSHKVIPFQEFWTFRRHGDGWRLHLIERNHSTQLDTPNYLVEQTAVRA